jgi:LysR family glycine cleavage system transcriptional activator
MTIPLPLLQTFVTVARSGSMKTAAESLAVTPSAVSQRVRELEDRSGCRLFIRGRTGVELTKAGRTLFSKIDQAFLTIEAVQTRAPRAPRSKRLVINTVPSFATTWLVPRLGSFSRVYPDIEVEVETDTRLIDPRREPVDLVIRHGLGKYPGLKCIWLMAPALVVVASPELIGSGRPIQAPSDCLSYPLLHDPDRQDWPLWFEAHGVAAEVTSKGPAFSDDHLLVRAAVTGQGLALVRDIYAAEDIEAGRLFSVLDLRWPTEFAYYLVGAPRTFAKPSVKRFAEWLTEEASEPASGTRR